jgi:hypothetical protein
MPARNTVRTMLIGMTSRSGWAARIAAVMETERDAGGVIAVGRYPRNWYKREKDDVKNQRVSGNPGRQPSPRALGGHHGVVRGTIIPTGGNVPESTEQ